MKRILLLSLFLFALLSKINAQVCPGDIFIVEDENLNVWSVESNGAQIFSLAEFVGSVNIGGIDYFQDDFGVDARGLILMAHDLSGNLLWSSQITGTSFFTTNPALTASPDKVFVSATAVENNNTEHILKIVSFAAPDGTPDWSKDYTMPVTSSNLPFGAQINPYAADIDASGRLIIAGAFSGVVTLGATTLTTSVGLSETFVMAVDETDGTDLWAVQSTGSNGLARAWTMKISPSDEIVLGGRFTGRIDFNGTSYTAANNTTTNPYIAKLNPANGTALWVSAFEGQTPGSINNIFNLTFTPFGGIYYVGSFNDAINVQGNDVLSASSGDGSTDALVGALNADGTYRWANQLGGVSTNDEFATTIEANSDGDLYIGVQLVTDQLFYANNALSLPPVQGHYFFGLDSLGAIPSPSITQVVSAEGKFGYDSYFNQSNNEIYYASLIRNTGFNVAIADLSSRPVPLIDIQSETLVLDPTETLSTFDPGGDYTFQWYFNGAPIGGETLATYTANVNGEYYVEVTAISGCTNRSESIYLGDGATLESDSVALVNLYINTNGDGWNDNTNWLVGNVNTWSGVTVSGNRVTELFLSGNNLNGNFATSFGNLQALEKLYLDNNNITGTVPNNFWSIPTLQEIVWHDNPNLSWSISPNIQNMINLRILRLFNSAGMGPIPAEIGNLSQLIEIDLSANQVSGNIPGTIGNLNNLSFMSLGNNQLSGSLPNEITNLTNLVHFNVRENQLSGTMPDGIWQLPNIQVIQVDYNADITVNLPANLNTLTQLTILGISGIRPIGGEFPSAFYDLTNLSVLDVGGHYFTGNLDPAINNLINLTGLWVFSNQLEGDFPDISSLTNLRAGSIGGNLFTSFPDISGLPLIESFDIAFNQLGFKDIIPNLGIEVLRYAPQNRRQEEYLQVNEGGNITLQNPYDDPGNNFTWIRNIEDTLSSATRNLTISGATLNDLGGYFAVVRNSVVPDLTIQTQFYNVAFSGPPRSWTVDNSDGSVADFKSLYAAIYGTNTNDTLFVLGSPKPYNLGGKLLRQPRVIYGPGYFLSKNPETQARSDSAYVNNIFFRSGAEGSEVYGLNILQVFINNQPSYINDTVRNVHLTGNKIYEMAIVDDAQNILINKNFINQMIFSSTIVNGVSRSYQDIFIENNIIDTVTTSIFRANAARNVMNNVQFNRNTINVFTDSISNANLNNNIINDYQATTNDVTNTRTYAEANFINNSGTLSVDNDFQTTNSGFNAGAYSGGNPYVLSGIPPLPHIFTLNDIGRIRFDAEAKSEDGSDIIALNYILGESSTVIQKGNVSRLEAGNPIQVLFRPRLGKVTPGANVDMMIWPRDANGMKGVPQRATFTAVTTTASGNIFTASNQPVTNGSVLLFEINQEGAAFDTLSTTLNNQGEFTFSNIVIGDYLALAEANTNDFPGHLPTYFEQIDLWEEADTLLIDSGDPTFDITLIAEPKDPEGNGTVAGILEEELPDSSTGGRTLSRGRVRKAGASMRRRIDVSRPGDEDEFELVEYVFTNDNGEFLFENLPVGEYRINIQYPGYPMDTTSNIDIVIEETRNDAYQLAALVDEGKISVTILSTTGILDEIIEKVRVYPNPATQEGVHIAFTKEINLKGEVTIELVDPKGNIATRKVIDSSKINTDGQINLPLTNINQGIYLLRMTHQNGEIGTLRIIIH